jgi:hypothetical protein
MRATGIWEAATVSWGYDGTGRPSNVHGAPLKPVMPEYAYKGGLGDDAGAADPVGHGGVERGAGVRCGRAGGPGARFSRGLDGQG